MPNEFGLDRWPIDYQESERSADLRPLQDASRTTCRVLNQEIDRLHARSRDVPGPDAEPSPEPDVEWDLDLIGRAIDGLELPDYAGVPDSGAATSSTRP